MLEYGTNEDGIKWVRYTGDCFYTLPSYELFTSIFGNSLSFQKCKDLESIIDGNMNFLYYVANQNLESLNLLLGHILAESKKIDKPFIDMIDCILLRYVGEYIATSLIDKSHVKNILDELMQSEYPLIYDVTPEEYIMYNYSESYWEGVRKHPRHILDDLLKQEKYQISNDSDALEEIIGNIISNNQDQFSRIKEEKILNWFVGQTMKETRGKYSPLVIKTKIIERL